MLYNIFYHTFYTLKMLNYNTLENDNKVNDTVASLTLYNGKYAKIAASLSRYGGRYAKIMASFPRYSGRDAMNQNQNKTLRKGFSFKTRGAMYHYKLLPNLYTTYYLFLLLLMVQR